MITIDFNEMSQCSGGYERGPVGEAICSSLGALIVTLLGVGVSARAVAAAVPMLGRYFTGLTIGMALGCWLSDVL